MSINHHTNAIRHLQERLTFMLFRHHLNVLEFTAIEDFGDQSGAWPASAERTERSRLISPTLEELTSVGLEELAKQQYEAVCRELDQVVPDFREMLRTNTMHLTVRIAREGTSYPLRFELHLRTPDGEETRLNNLVTSR